MLMMTMLKIMLGKTKSYTYEICDKPKLFTKYEVT